MKVTLIAGTLLASAIVSFAESPDKTVPYKETPQGELKLHVFNPPDHFGETIARSQGIDILEHFKTEMPYCNLSDWLIEPTLQCKVGSMSRNDYCISFLKCSSLAALF